MALATKGAPAVSRDDATELGFFLALVLNAMLIVVLVALCSSGGAP